jgi:hypothetical protein
MTQYHKGQEVIVCVDAVNALWSNARITSRMVLKLTAADEYEVAFPDGSRAVFDADHIRVPFHAYLANEYWEK